jgi:hypothetical protein
MFLRRPWVAGLLLSVSGLAIASPVLVADYQFDNSLASSISGAPDLALVGLDTGYASEQVLYYLPPQTVLTFSAGSGVALNPTTQILSSPGVYTIALQVRITDTSVDLFSKYIDFNNATADAGLYDNGGRLEFYPQSSGSGLVIGTKYADVVLTRDGSGLVAGYFNGMPQFSYDDSVVQLGVIDAANTLRFFLDDTVGAGTEQSPGAVARIRIWDGALDAEAVKELTDPIFADGFEGT